MKKFILFTCSLLTIFFSFPTCASAQTEPGFPVPEGNPKQLFYLQRSQNTNTIVYELNLKGKVPDSIAPVHIFWIRYAEQSQKQELTNIQRKYAYGLATKYVSKDHYELRFLASKKLVFQLIKGADQHFHVYHTINGKNTILTSIYLQINGGARILSSYRLRTLYRN